MKIIFYCQHVLGLGHFFRSLEICKALSDHEVILATGGPRPDVRLDRHIREVKMPGLMMDPEFTGLFSVEKNNSLEKIKADRKKLLLQLMKSESPDIFFLELYPFGRKAFRFELDPVLEQIRKPSGPSCRVICSLRDILVEKKETEKYERRVVEIVNRCFDAVFVHSDPGLFRLEETFSRAADIKIPLVYTGFVAPGPPPGAKERIRKKLKIKPGQKLVIASAGGGKIGAPLLEASITALKKISRKTHVRAEVFSGPFMDHGDFSRLNKLADDKISVRRFTSDFLSYLAAADLSISMAGYNTCMNLLACKARALLLPFSQNREQRLRAERLAQKAPFTVLNEADITPDRLAKIISERLLQNDSSTAIINLLGSSCTARSLEKMFGSHKYRKA